MRSVQIDDHTFDIHKLQNPKKHKGQTCVNEMKIEGMQYSGIDNIVNVFQVKTA